MRIRFTKEQQEFRQEVSAFLEAETPPERRTIYGEFSEEKYWFGRALARKLAGKGWLTVGWPKEYGGGGKTFIEQSILDEQIGYHRVQRVGLTGLNFAGPAIMKFGSEEQKSRFLPPIARGEVEYCQGFTEPNAGSDLASLEMQARRDGDSYVLNGSKMFTSYYAHADYIYLLARTDPHAPKHRGISLFIVEMSAPGVSTRPLPYINGEVAAQTFFDDVRAPASALVGEENRGWYHAMTTLDYERAGLERYARVRRAFDDFVDFCRGSHYDGKPLSHDPVVRRKLAILKVGYGGLGLALLEGGVDAEPRPGSQRGGVHSLSLRHTAEVEIRPRGHGDTRPTGDPHPPVRACPPPGSHRRSQQGEPAPARRGHHGDTPQHHRPAGLGTPPVAAYGLRLHPSPGDAETLGP